MSYAIDFIELTDNPEMEDQAGDKPEVDILQIGLIYSQIIDLLKLISYHFLFLSN